MAACKTTNWLAVTLAASIAVTAGAQDAATKPAPAPAAPASATKVQSLPAGQSKRLEAVVMDVKGSAQWRAAEKDAWQAAKVDDVLSTGTQIRTGRDSGVTLRAGHNATIMVAAMTRVDLPEIIQDGATLRTRAGLARGKADFKVDQVGLVNDFEVITPSSTLAVRGTGFGVRWGGLDGASVSGFDGNQIAAIELRYFSTRMGFVMSGRGISNEKHPNPVIAALYHTITPPPAVGKVVDNIEAALASGMDFDASYQQLQQVNVGVQSVTSVSDFLTEVQSPLPPDFDITIPEGINPSFFFAQLLCSEQSGFTSGFQQGLIAAGLLDPKTASSDPNFASFTAGLSKFCSSLESGTFAGDDPFLHMVDLVQSYCGTHKGQMDFDECIAAAGAAMGMSFSQALSHQH